MNLKLVEVEKIVYRDHEPKVIYKEIEKPVFKDRIVEKIVPKEKIVFKDKFIYRDKIVEKPVYNQYTQQEP